MYKCILKMLVLKAILTAAYPEICLCTVRLKRLNQWLFPPPFEKRRHTVLHLSVCWSVDQVMSTQYLLILLLENSQTCYSGFPYRGINFWSAKYLLTPLLLSCQSWYSSCPWRVLSMLFINFRAHGERSRSNCWSLSKDSYR